MSRSSALTCKIWRAASGCCSPRQHSATSLTTEMHVMKAVISLFRLPHHLVRLARERRGVAAVEFAMLLPLMVTLYLGSVEISQGVGINRKVTLTSRTVADLASQVATINNADMTNFLNAAWAVIAPYDVTKLKVTVLAVQI